MILELKNFMGYTGEIDLEDYTICFGPNGSGKSRVRKALEFVYTGSIGSKNLPGAIFLEYASSDSFMKVTLTLGPTTITRGIRYDLKKGSYSSDAEYIVGKRAIASGKKEVDLKLKEENVFAPIVFSYNDLLLMKSTDRRKFILDMVGFNEPTKQEIINKLIEAEAYNDECDIPSSLDAAIDYAVKERTYYEREKKKFKGAVASLNELKSEMLGNTKNIGKLEQEKQEVVLALQQCAVALEKANNAIAAAEKKQSAIVRKKEELKVIKETDYTNELFELQKDMEVVRKGIKKVPLIKDYAKEFEEIDKLISENEEKQEVVTKEQVKLMSERNKIEYEIQSINSRIIEISEFEGTCPVFGYKCTQDGLKDVTEINTKLQEYSKRLETTNKNDFSFDIESLKATKKELLEKRHQLYDKKVQSINEANTITLANSIIEKELGLCNSKIDMIEMKDGNRINEINRILKEIEILEKEEISAYDPIELTEGIIAANELKLNDIDFKLEALKEKQNTAALAIESSKRYEEIEATHKLFDSMYKSLNAFKVEKMSERLEPVKNEVDKVLKIFGKKAELYFELVDENGKDQLNFGWMTEKSRITNLSDGEQIIMSIGIISALQEITGVINKTLIIDELLSLDAENVEIIINSKELQKMFTYIFFLSPYELTSKIYETLNLKEL